MYTIRGDKERLMYIIEYLDTIRPYLVVLIDEKRSSNQKITKKDRITFYVNSKNIVCYPSSDSNDILNQLYESLLEYFNEKLLICRTDSSYLFERIQGFSIHFHKIDLRRASSYIPSPSWIEFKKSCSKS